MGFHKNVTGQNVHTPISFVFDDATDLDSGFYPDGSTAITTSDLYKLAYQLDADKVWILISLTPLTWKEYKGDDGIQGVTGLRGADGYQGSDGSTGVQGIQGVTGLQGVDGYLGADGATGIQGETGFGIQGDTGLAGTMGPTGPEGAPDYEQMEKYFTDLDAYGIFATVTWVHYPSNVTRKISNLIGTAPYYNQRQITTFDAAGNYLNGFTMTLTYDQSGNLISEAA